MSAPHEGIVSVGTAKMIGFILAICGNTLIACSLTLQKSAHNLISRTTSEYADQSPPNSSASSANPASIDGSDGTSSTSSTRGTGGTGGTDSTDSTFQSPDHDFDAEAQLQLPPSISQFPNEPRESRQNPDEFPLAYDDVTILGDVRSPSGLAFLRNPTWWMGTFLMAAGEVGNFAAFAFAPASLVAPLGAWSVVLSAILAHVFLHEAVSNTNAIGIALCVTGAFLIGTSGPDVSAAEAALDADAVTKLLIRIPFVVFMLLTLTATAALIHISHNTTLGQHYIFIYVGVSSLLGGVTVVCAKALSTFLRMTIEGNSQFGNLLPFALGLILATAILAQLRYLNMAMAQFGNAQVIPVYYVLFTTCAMTSGVIMYREFDELTVRNLPFFLGICATMTGVMLVSRSAHSEDSDSSATNSRLPDDLDDFGSFSSSTRNAVERGKRPKAQNRYERVLPVSPMSSPRSNH